MSPLEVLVALAIVVLWWWFRPEGARHASLPESQDVPASMAGADPDDILVDLRNDASDATVAAIEKDLGIAPALQRLGP